MDGDVTYTDGYTLDGRVKPGPGVTRAKVMAVKKMVEATMRGDRIEKGRLEESLTTSDAIFSYAYLTTINILPQFDRAVRTWTQVAGTRTVPDFRKPVLYSLVANWNQPGVLNAGSNSGQFNGAAPVVPELESYPEVHFQGEEAIAGGLQKRGVKTSFSFESWINDSVGALQALPEQMLRIALDTEEYAVFSTLVQGGTLAGSQVAGGTVPDGTTVTSNAVLSRPAVIRAIYELKLRKINGRFVQVNGGYNLLVGVGQGVYANFMLSQAYSLYNEGAVAGVTNAARLQFNVAGYDPLAAVTVIETPYVTAPAWFLLPKPGTTVRPVIDLLHLAGHESPELRIEDFTGLYTGGGEVSPFEGSFQNDDVKFRLRHIIGGALWSPALVVYSRGDASAVS